MPRADAVFVTRTVCWCFRRPSAANVRRIVSGCPMVERICFTSSALAVSSLGMTAA